MKSGINFTSMGQFMGIGMTALVIRLALNIASATK